MKYFGIVYRSQQHMVSQSSLKLLSLIKIFGGKNLPFTPYVVCKTVKNQRMPYVATIRLLVGHYMHFS